MAKILTKIRLLNGNVSNQYDCIWDTGSMETLISNRVVQDLNPDKHGYVYLNTIHGEEKSDKYILNLLLENHTKSIRINSACFGKSREFDVIIGMDIINYGLFILDHGNLTFTIEQLK